jgi:isocitrate/isopropylmalate dehydrogenase
MLDFLGWNVESNTLDSAVKAAVHANFVTPDLGFSRSTPEVGDWLVRYISEAAKMSTHRQ